jgi:hypothetical protein
MIRIMLTDSGFEQGRNDYHRLEQRWPASTGWLIVSILFANKLWIGDVTSMSLYWVARLPIKRPKGQTSYLSPMRRPERAALATAAPNGGRGRQWKIALSLAIVGAVVAPFVFRTFKANTNYKVWVPLTAQEKENLANYLKDNRDCHPKPGFIRDYTCELDEEEFRLNGRYQVHSDSAKYLTLSAGVAAAAFAVVFSLALLIPMLVRGFALLIRRYWEWLNA